MTRGTFDMQLFSVPPRLQYMRGLMHLQQYYVAIASMRFHRYLSSVHYSPARKISTL